ncbi:hypothetical protein [Bacillus mycoides]|uniref:hypothetical protein n=1 Tax=Bacillus mycoides TaxID=1405 RepID=UPI003A8070B0
MTVLDEKYLRQKISQIESAMPKDENDRLYMQGVVGAFNSLIKQIKEGRLVVSGSEESAYVVRDMGVMGTSEQTTPRQTLGTDVKLNLGGFNKPVNVHINESGALLIEGLQMRTFHYNWVLHSENVTELKIIAPSRVMYG